MNVIVDDLLTNYQITGKGKLVVFLHGWGDTLQGSKALQAQLATSYQILAMDLPGFGQTQAPQEVWDLDSYAQFVADCIAKLGLGSPYAIIGHSNGGAIAIRGLSLGVLQAKKLVLLAAAGNRTGGGARRVLLQILAKTGNLATVWLPDRYRKTLRTQLYKSAGSDLLVVPGLQETFKKTVRQDVQPDAANLKLPTLLVYARNDAAVPLQNGERYHELIKGSTLRVLDDAGHFVHLDQPQLVDEAIEEFLR